MANHQEPSGHSHVARGPGQSGVKTGSWSLTGKIQVHAYWKNRTHHIQTSDLGRQELTVVQEEKDHSIIIMNDPKPSKQCAEAARKATTALRYTRQSFISITMVDLIEVHKMFLGWESQVISRQRNSSKWAMIAEEAMGWSSSNPDAVYSSDHGLRLNFFSQRIINRWNVCQTGC